MRIDILTGQRFGRLLVLSFLRIDRNKKQVWLCLCDCGEVKPIIGAHLKNKRVRSCGCLQREHRLKYKVMNLGKRAW